MTGYEWWWSWLLTLPQLFAYWQVGNLRRWAWLLAFTVDVLWVVYSLLTSQYGFLTSAVLFGALALRNWWRWRSDATRYVRRVFAWPAPEHVWMASYGSLRTRS